MTTRDPHPVLRRTIGAAFLGAAAIQATHRDTFSRLVPQNLPIPQEKVQAGMTVALAGIGASFLVPRLRGVARWSSTAVLVSSLPAAVGQVRHPEELEEVGLPPALAPVRIVAQLAMIAGIWRATGSGERP